MLEASLALNRSRLVEAETDLARTEIRMPFDARIAEVTIEQDQFVAAGQTMAEADSIDVAEVTAQMGIDRLVPLIDGEIDLSTLTAQELSSLPNAWGLQATVRLEIGELRASWAGRFDRVSDMIDPQTRTLGLIISVEEPYRQAIPGRRPPLAKNMFVEVEVRGRPRDGVIVVPRTSVHRSPSGNPVVFIAGPDDRLEFRPIEPGPAQDDFLVVLVRPDGRRPRRGDRPDPGHRGHAAGAERRHRAGRPPADRRPAATLRFASSRSGASAP